MTRIHEVALSMPCRSAHCHAPAGQKCNRKTKRNWHHRIRYNDAYHVLTAEAKMADWNRRYGRTA